MRRRRTSIRWVNHAPAVKAHGHRDAIDLSPSWRLRLLAGGFAACAADPLPNRPIHWVVGFPAGGPTDTVARLVGDPLSDRLGQQVVIENRSGAGGMVAAASVINAAPDGYELMFVAPNNAIGATLYKNLRALAVVVAKQRGDQPISASAGRPVRRRHTRNL